MTGLGSRLWKWILKKSDLPDIWEAFPSICDNWEEGQYNDIALFEQDPFGEVAGKARAQLKVDPEKGFAALLGLAEGGSVWSMLWVAACYHSGIGVGADSSQVEHWYRQALEGGAQRAQIYCGRRAARRGDVTQAEDILRVGVVDGWAPAMCWFAKVKLQRSDDPKTFAEVLPLLQYASEKGSLRAELAIARRLMRGQGGLRRVLEGVRRKMALGKIITEKMQSKIEAAKSAVSDDGPPETATIH